MVEFHSLALTVRVAELFMLTSGQVNATQLDPRTQSYTQTHSCNFTKCIHLHQVQTLKQPLAEVQHSVLHLEVLTNRCSTHTFKMRQNVKFEKARPTFYSFIIIIGLF